MHQIIRAIQVAKQINDIYWAKSLGDEVNGRVSIENLRRAIQEYTGKLINIFEVDADPGAIRGFFERYPERCDIYLRSDQPDVWKRFVAVKEMAHAAIDEEAEFNCDGVVTLREIISSDFVLLESSPAAASEKVAELIALELIYPIESRRDDLLKKTDGRICVSDIVTKRGVPDFWIEVGLDPRVMGALDSGWRGAVGTP